ncbi:hypothetical protein BG006_000434 [Podila minutissima]|uniref:Uncharacterized protein n=1 Tax=Podila minutissima TaxID=64525 RepID=A0A9P5STT1_9FUNG|nr:hypothetical protein BG006_000434 [Podila minutissima]
MSYFERATPLKLRRNASCPSFTLPIPISEPEKPEPVQGNSHYYSLIVALTIILSVFSVDTGASYHYYTTTTKELRKGWWLVFGNNVVAVLSLSLAYIAYGLSKARFNRILCYWTVAMIAWVPVAVAIWAVIDKVTGKSAWFKLENGYRGEGLKHCERVVGSEEVSFSTFAAYFTLDFVSTILAVHLYGRSLSELLYLFYANVLAAFIFAQYTMREKTPRYNRLLSYYFVAVGFLYPLTVGPASWWRAS